MTKEYEKYLAYRKARELKEKELPKEYSDYLIHYGVKGQKWGTRQWQNTDGTYTEAGKHHYGWGYGRQNGGMTPNAQRPRSGGYQGSRQRVGTRSVNGSRQTQQRRQMTPEQIAARKAKTRRVLAIAAGVAVAAALSYGAYKGSTKLRDNMRADVHRTINTDSRNLHTLTSKYWDSADRKTYSELSKKRANEMANSITRRDAVAAKFTEKTGLRINVPKSREKVLAQRKSENDYANFIREAEKRGLMNKSIHDARQDLKAAQKKLVTYQNTPHMGTSKQYEQYWNQRHQESVEAARKRLQSLLTQRRAG